MQVSSAASSVVFKASVCNKVFTDGTVFGLGLFLNDLAVFIQANIVDDNIHVHPTVVDDEIYQKKDLIKVAKEYGEFYLLQDHRRENGLTDVSVIKSSNGMLEYYIENEGKVWKATKDGFKFQLCDGKNLIEE